MYENWVQEFLSLLHFVIQHSGLFALMYCNDEKISYGDDEKKKTKQINACL